MATTEERIGEVVEAQTQGFSAQCYRLYEAPPLGSIVRTLEPAIYAVVSEVRTEGLDPGRPVIARGEEEELEESIYQHNPQLAQLLCTRFHALTIAYDASDILVHGLPPLPPRIHAFVYPTPAAEVGKLTRSLDFLHLLVSSGAPSTDEVVAACLRLASRQVADGEEFLVRAGKALAVELTGQLPRLNAILRRLS
jgi:hypothetical protein